MGYSYFQIAVLIVGMQNQIMHIRTVVERTEYFSDTSRVVNLDNPLPRALPSLSSMLRGVDTARSCNPPGSSWPRKRTSLRVP